MLEFLFDRLLLLSILSLLFLSSCQGDDTTPNFQVFAWYFPQFYPFPENNKNWGKDFTDWSLVKVSPEENIYGIPVQKPGELGYYDLRNLSTRQEQRKLAKAYGLDGFIFYHYWLENRPVMREVLDQRLTDGEPGLPFMLCLVNEPWLAKFYNLQTKRLGGGGLLLKMLYDAPEKLFQYLLPFFRHKDYVKVEGKPVYVVYRSPKSSAFDHNINTLRRLATEHGFPGLHIVQCLQSIGRSSYLHTWADAGMEFSPNLQMVDQKCGTFPPSGKYQCRKDLNTFNGVPTSLAWDASTARRNKEVIEKRFFRSNHDLVNPRCVYNLKGEDKPIYRGGTVAWDATPRYPLVKGDALPKHNIIPYRQVSATPQSFFNSTVTRLCKTLCDPNRRGHPNFYTLFAWNEWGEGATLEPSQQDRRGYLEALKRAKEHLQRSWPGGCRLECEEMRRMQLLKDCHASIGCFSGFDCWSASDRLLNNNEYKQDTTKKTMDVALGRDDGIRITITSFNQKISDTFRAGWQKVLNFVAARRTVVEMMQANFVLVDFPSWYFYTSHQAGIKIPWVGIFHEAGWVPEDAPNDVKYTQTMAHLLKEITFNRSMPYCKGIITLSPSWQQWFVQLDQVKENKVPVYAMKHPVHMVENVKPFTMGDFRKNRGRWRVAMLGSKHRRISTIYHLQINYKKVWLPGLPIDIRSYYEQRRRKELKTDKVTYRNDVAIFRTASQGEYRYFLRTNIIIMDFWTAASHLAVVECLKLQVPVFIRKLDPIVDYFGPGYPLYFTSVEQLEDMLSSEERMLQLVELGHQYLRNLDLSDMSLSKFNNRITEIIHMAMEARDDPLDSRSVAVVVPAFVDLTHSPTLEASMRLLQQNFVQGSVSFRCVLYASSAVINSNSTAFLRLASTCQVLPSRGSWAADVAQFQGPKESHVALLAADVDLSAHKIDGVALLDAMFQFRYDGVAPAVDDWVFKSMKPRVDCEAHRTDHLHWMFAIFTLETWECLQRLVDPTVNAGKWGYDVTLSFKCKAKMGVSDTQVLVAPRGAVQKSLLEIRRGLVGSYDWIKKALEFSDDAQAASFWRFVTVQRSKEFAYCQMPVPVREELDWVPTMDALSKDRSICKEQPTPTQDRPFLFFHIPRVGGTSLRDQIVLAAEAEGLKHMVPGVTIAGEYLNGSWEGSPPRSDCPFNSVREPMACMYHERVACAQVIGGHLGVSLPKAMARAWNKPAKCSRWNESVAVGNEVPFDSFTCLVMMRHPLERVMSCYKYFDEEQLGEFVDLPRHKKLDVARRCGGNVATLYLGGSPPYTRGRNNEEVQGQGGSMATAKKAVDHCVVGLTARWAETHRVLARAFPWLLGGLKGGKHRLHTKHATPTDLSVADAEALHGLLAEDLELYKYAEEKFEKVKQCFFG